MYDTQTKADIARHEVLAKRAIASMPSYPESGYSGCGIVTSADRTHLVCAWVLVRSLRALGCDLPIEIWHLVGEVAPRWQTLLEPYNVAFIACEESIDNSPNQWSQDGYGLKAHSLLHCSFEEALYLDTDIVPVRDPRELFTATQYDDSGAVFWPDMGIFGRPYGIFWTLSNQPYHYPEREIDSAQLLVDKRRCWSELHLAMHYNRHAHFYYRWLGGGDKETFHLAWRRLGKPYALIPHLPQFHQRRTETRTRPTLSIQHDWQGKPLFQHRVGSKWGYTGNQRIPDFVHEDMCFGFIEELREHFADCTIPIN